MMVPSALFNSSTVLPYVLSSAIGGAFVGFGVGKELGLDDGLLVGPSVGLGDGTELGLDDGVLVGPSVGFGEGTALGLDDGVLVGPSVGLGEGTALGMDDGVLVGPSVGAELGLDEEAIVERSAAAIISSPMTLIVTLSMDEVPSWSTET